MKRAFTTALLVVAAGCADDRREVRVTPVFPPDDVEAAQRSATFDVLVFDAADEVCRDLVAWRRAVCGAACTPPPIPDVAAPVVVTRRDAGWSAASVDVGSSDVDVVIVARDADGGAFLYGCTTVGDEDARVRLFRPWCDLDACAGQFHPACPVEIDCSAAPSDDPDGLGPPRCVPLAAIVWTFEEAGASCAPTDGALYAPCRPARIVCEAGRTTPDSDGICPGTGAASCGATLAEDLDCDGSFPGPCGDCTPGTTTTCGPPGACAGTARCTAEGSYGSCRLPVGATESCGDGDEDCDGIADADDPDAFTACNVGRTTGAPAADRCDGSACLCGSDPPCEAGEACCGGECLDVTTDALHCGRCNDACAPGLTCLGGTCLPPGCVPETCNGLDEDCDGLSDDADPDALFACNATDPSRPVADACDGDTCRCGGETACGGGETCCSGACVDTQTDGGNCGGCGVTCPTGQRCAMGRCTSCGAERCGGGDDDCDGVDDTMDPDAVDDCNAGRSPLAPAANLCDFSGNCGCGFLAFPEAPCTGPRACCDNDCRDLRSDPNHCGGCNIPCAGTCSGGVCM